MKMLLPQRYSLSQTQASVDPTICGFLANALPVSCPQFQFPVWCLVVWFEKAMNVKEQLSPLFVTFWYFSTSGNLVHSKKSSLFLPSAAALWDIESRKWSTSWAMSGNCRILLSNDDLTCSSSASCGGAHLAILQTQIYRMSVWSLLWGEKNNRLPHLLKDWRSERNACVEHLL